MLTKKDRTKLANDALEICKLEYTRLTAQQLVPLEIVERMQFDISKSNIPNHLVLQLRTLVVGEVKERLEETVTFKYPRSWFQMLKAQYLPKWLKRKFPIKYRTKSQTVYGKLMECYPQAPASIRKGPHYSIVEGSVYPRNISWNE